MTTIIQDIKITKYINSKQISDEYTMMITYHDIVYTTKITKNTMNSNLFDFDMLENLIYNCNHKQLVGDIQCDMILAESESFGKNLDMTLLFERDVKPMKKINERHIFQLQEKKLDYDDKIGLAMTNLRNEINFIVIKPVTKIIRIKLDYSSAITDYTIPTGISFYKLNNEYVTFPPFICNKFTKKGDIPQQGQSPFDINSRNHNLLSDEFKQYMTYKTDVNIHWELLEYIQKYTTIIDNNIKININLILQNNYVDSVCIQDTNSLIIFIDETKKPNNRKIVYHLNIANFIKTREQFKIYHILENTKNGILVEEL